MKPPTKGKNQFFDMPKESKGRLAAVAGEGSGQAAVYMGFPKGPVGDRIYAALLEDQAAINEAIGQPVKWYSTDNWQGLSIRREFGDQMLTKHRAEVQAWLGDVVNRFVNAFRARIEAALRDQ